MCFLYFVLTTAQGRCAFRGKFEQTCANLHKINMHTCFMHSDQQFSASNSSPLLLSPHVFPHSDQLVSAMNSSHRRIDFPSHVAASSLHHTCFPSFLSSHSLAAWADRADTVAMLLSVGAPYRIMARARPRDVSGVCVCACVGRMRKGLNSRNLGQK
jgi:hypothetical protein